MVAVATAQEALEETVEYLLSVDQAPMMQETVLAEPNDLAHRQVRVVAAVVMAGAAGQDLAGEVERVGATGEGAGVMAAGAPQRTCKGGVIWKMQRSRWARWRRCARWKRGCAEFLAISIFWKRSTRLC